MTRLMSMLTAVLCLTASIFTAQGAVAQVAEDVTYIQIEAQPSLTRAQDRARDYASILPDVNGFALGAGWYGIALGPYPRAQAQQLLRQYRVQGQIPRDAYLEEPERFRGQFWPVGASAVTAAPATPPQAPQTETPQTEAAPQTAANLPEPVVPDETLRQAQRSEGLLNSDERKQLQIALQWAGFYEAAIDGAFGRGTRRSMVDWQEANNVQTTGVLTTRQRAELLRQYNAVLDGLGMRIVSEPRSGIEIALPMGILAFDKYESPFVHYTATGDIAAEVHLISQPGDQTTLFGLYDILQTLAIVPLDGPRNRRNQDFAITGGNDRIVTHIEAELSGRAIKGFMLVWPVNDEERRTRVLGEMQASFRATEGVLPMDASSGAQQAVDLVSGLAVRRPKLSRSGFYVSSDGIVVTSADAVSSCSRITLDEQYETEIIAQDAALGVAVLRPKSPLAPISVAQLRLDTPRLQSDVAVAGYPYQGALGAPTLTFGTLADMAGLQGEVTQRRLALEALPGDAGGPVLDAGGAVLGMLLPPQADGRQLPGNVAFATASGAVNGVLSRAGLQASETSGDAAMAPEDLSALASGMTVLVSCWE